MTDRMDYLETACLILPLIPSSERWDKSGCPQQLPVLS